MFRKTLGLSPSLFCASSVFATDLSLEPCVNGDVSASDSFPTQAMKDQIYADLDWRSDQSYFRFAVASRLVARPFEASAMTVDER